MDVDIDSNPASLSIEQVAGAAMVKPKSMCYIIVAPRLQDFISRRRIPCGDPVTSVLR
jgi:hypothetical protein